MFRSSATRRREKPTMSRKLKEGLATPGVHATRRLSRKKSHSKMAWVCMGSQINRAPHHNRHMPTQLFLLWWHRTDRWLAGLCALCSCSDHVSFVLESLASGPVLGLDKPDHLRGVCMAYCLGCLMCLDTRHMRPHLQQAKPRFTCRAGVARSIVRGVVPVRIPLESS